VQYWTPLEISLGENLRTILRNYLYNLSTLFLLVDLSIIAG
jgi:hypothetical protein